MSNYPHTVHNSDIYVRAVRFYKMNIGGQRKSEGNLILKLMFLGHLNHLETTEIIQRALKPLVGEILRIKNLYPKNC